VKRSAGDGGASCAVNHENIFVAKICDSESALRRFCASKRLALTPILHRAHRATVREIAATQGFPAIVENADLGGAHVSRIVISTHCAAIARDAACAVASLRQHFLKWDAVFFDLLVYSGWCASRFPSARSERSHLTTSGGQHGQESEEGEEEGEERREEVCEEDSQGFEEEEHEYVISPRLELPAAFLPARHWTAGGLLSQGGTAPIV
jgi:hypothetical protein